MRLRAAVLFAVLAVVSLTPWASASAADEYGRARFERDVDRVKADYRDFYLGEENLSYILGVGAASGLIANTNVDREFREYYQTRVRRGFTDDVSTVFRYTGELYVALPLLTAAHLVREESRPSGAWADVSLRAVIVGAPAVFVLQRVTGAGRPDEGGSRWRPLDNDNGVSGHSFVGAVPFIAAARMQDGAYAKALLFAVSAFPALSRVNDDRHYLSQTVFGWSLAYLSVRTAEGHGGGAAKVAYFILPEGRDGLSLHLAAAF